MTMTAMILIEESDQFQRWTTGLTSTSEAASEELSAGVSSGFGGVASPGFPIRIPPSEKKNMQNDLHFEPPFPLSCLPFVLIQPQRVINVAAVMECLRDYCCHGMPERFCGTCASAFLLQVFCCSVSSCVFLIRRQSCLVLLLHLLAAGFSETLETQVHTLLYIYII